MNDLGTAVKVGRDRYSGFGSAPKRCLFASAGERECQVRTGSALKQRQRMHDLKTRWSKVQPVAKQAKVQRQLAAERNQHQKRQTGMRQLFRLELGPKGGAELVRR